MGATGIVMHQTQAHPEVTRQVRDFYKWAYEHGDTVTEGLDYIPMPEQIVQLID
jgi:phosphate transport system substrate-binding protein